VKLCDDYGRSYYPNEKEHIILSYSTFKVLNVFYFKRSEFKNIPNEEGIPPNLVDVFRDKISKSKSSTQESG
jgi:hypothetical protein